MSDLRRERADVEHAICKAIGNAVNWHQIVQMADALRSAQRRADQMQKEMEHLAQEQCGGQTASNLRRWEHDMKPTRRPE